MTVGAENLFSYRLLEILNVLDCQNSVSVNFVGMTFHARQKVSSLFILFVLFYSNLVFALNESWSVY